MASQEVQDLTVKECEEASSYRLSREDYVGLRRKLLDRARSAMAGAISDQVGANLRKDPKFRESIAAEERESLRKKIRPEVEAELLPKLKERAEAELGQKARQEAEAKLASELPSDECRAVYSSYMREVETEAASLAETASEYGDRVLAKQRADKLLRKPAATLGWLSIIPAALWMISHGYNASSIVLWGVLATIVAAAGVATHGYVCAAEERAAFVKSMRDRSSDYMLIVDEAKRVRMSVIPTAKSVAEIRAAAQAVADRKRSLDNQFAPAIKDLNENRKKMRVRALEEINPLDVIGALEADRRRPELEAAELEAAELEAEEPQKSRTVGA